jgi:hypothetical protein
MSTRNKVAIAMLLASMSAARSDGIGGGIGQGLGGGVGGFDGGISANKKPGSGGRNCIEYAVSSCIQYQSGSSLLVQ